MKFHDFPPTCTVSCLSSRKNRTAENQHHPFIACKMERMQGHQKWPWLLHTAFSVAQFSRNLSYFITYPLPPLYEGKSQTQRHIHTSTHASTHTCEHALAFNGPFSGTTRVSRYQKGKTNLDFTEARDSEWQWHQLGHMQVCTSSPLSFLQAGCPSCRPTNSVKALKS